MINFIFKSASGFASWIDAVRVRVAGRFVMTVPITIERAFAIAENLRDKGRVDRAIELLETALQQIEDMIGSDDHSALSCRNNIAVCYLGVGREAEAIELLEPIVERREADLGVDHRDMTSVNSVHKVFATAFLPANRLA